MSGIAPVGITTSTNVRPAFQGEPQPIAVDETEFQPVVEEKHGSFLGAVFKLIVAAGVIAGGLVGAKYLIKEAPKTTEGFVNQAKSFLFKTGEAIENFVKEAYAKVKGFFDKKTEPKGEAPTTEEKK